VEGSVGEVSAGAEIHDDVAGETTVPLNA